MQVDWVSLILGTVAGALVSAPIGFWFALLATRPHLAIIGGGGGPISIPGLTARSVTIANRPGIFGLSLGETIIFGHWIFDRFQFGLPIQRETARDCTASLRTPDGIAYLPVWRADDGSFTHSVDIECGRSAALYLILTDTSSREYFPFVRPDQLTEGAPRYTGRQTFDLVVRCRGAVMIKAKVKLSQDHQGNLSMTAGELGPTR